MSLVKKAALGPQQHECAYVSYKPLERDSTWFELLVADPAKVTQLLLLFRPEQQACRLDAA